MKLGTKKKADEAFNFNHFSPHFLRITSGPCFVFPVSKEKEISVTYHALSCMSLCCPHHLQLKPFLIPSARSNRVAYFDRHDHLCCSLYFFDYKSNKNNKHQLRSPPPPCWCRVLKICNNVYIKREGKK